MGKKAWMKAVRETCGISQADLADVLGVRTLTAKRWEKPGEAEPPADVLAYLKEQLGFHDAYVSELVVNMVANLQPGDAVRMDIYRSQSDADLAYEGTGTPAIPYQRFNAMQIDAANRLRAQGVDVIWCHPDEEHIQIDFD